ncbi:MAG: hypothetical protein HGB11_09730 [Chlorobiales bacterium]|nr:hypothetical protein [Chlorobiales bacterium]
MPGHAISQYDYAFFSQVETLLSRDELAHRMKAFVKRWNSENGSEADEGRSSQYSGGRYA